jgi:hypothetical protein
VGGTKAVPSTVIQKQSTSDLVLSKWHGNNKSNSNPFLIRESVGEKTLPANAAGAVLHN